MTSAPARCTFLVVALLAGALVSSSAHAQAWTRFTVPDSALGAAITASGAQFEPAWNALFVAELRAAAAHADSADRLLALERRIAAAEPKALGTHVTADALALRARWTPAQRRTRIAAAVAESLGTLANTGRDFARADSLFDVARHGYESVGETRRAGWAIRSLGSVAYSLGRRDRADTLGRLALAHARAGSDLRLMSLALNMLGTIQLANLDYANAWEYFQAARLVREQLGDLAALGTTMNNLALIAKAQGRADTAQVYFRRALELTVAQGDSARTGDVLNNYALLLMDGGDPARARAISTRALVIARSRGDLVLQARLTGNLGLLSLQAGHFAEALPRLEQARGLAIAGRDAALLQLTLVEIGRVWIGLGDGAAARPPLERAQALADSLGDRRGRAQALDNLAIAARLDGDPNRAARLAADALEAAVASGDSTLVHAATTTLGQQAFDRGDLGAAGAWFERAAASGANDPVQRSGDASNRGAVAARSGRLNEAERHFRDALALAETAHASDVVWPALLGLGDVAERRGEVAKALAFDRQAATMIEGLRAEQGADAPSVRLLARRLFAFEALIHLLTRLQPAHPESAWAAEAFHWSERSRARAFLDLVAASGGTAEKPRPLTLAEAQTLIHTDRDALLAYGVGDSSTSLWVITQRTWTHVALPPRRALRTRIELFRRGLADPATADARSTHAASHALFETLVAPALPLLRGVDHLIVAPDGALALVPFEALLAESVDRDGAAPKNAYLVERWAVSYTPSASALATRMASPREQSRGGIVALGDPMFAPDSGRATPTLQPLPNTAAEMATLEQLAGHRPITVLTGRDATRERWLQLAELSRASLIHVATHGEANEAEPERSGLWLAAHGAEPPGFVSVADILALRLRAGLVTLSACETGLGRLEGGEGVVGLTRAFLAAGSQSVMVSLWKVNDRSTALLMDRFYRGYLAKGAAGSAALANAKRALLRDSSTRSPFYWAPFVLIGSAGPLGG
jgi:CHAT domain-containing protein